MQKLVLGTLILLLAGCADAPPPAVTLDSSAMPQVNLNVLTVSVVDHAPPQPATSPYRSNNFQPTIVGAIRQWASQKLTAVGDTGDAVVVIKDASLTAQTIPHADDMFTRQQASKYSAHVAIELRVNARGHMGQVEAEASRYVTLPEDPSPLERQNAYITILNGLLHDLGADITSGAETNLNDFLVTVGNRG